MEHTSINPSILNILVEESKGFDMTGLEYNINEFEQVLITIRGKNTGRRQGRSQERLRRQGRQRSRLYQSQLQPAASQNCHFPQQTQTTTTRISPIKQKFPKENTFNQRKGRK